MLYFGFGGNPNGNTLPSPAPPPHPPEGTPGHIRTPCRGPCGRVRNTLGQKIEVRDAAGNLFLTAAGQFKPVGYARGLPPCRLDFVWCGPVWRVG